MRIKFVGFSALWGDKADFRIWNFNEEAGFSQVLELGLPHGVVPGSASGTLLVSGGLHLPLYSPQTDSTDQWAEVWRDSQLSAASASLAPLLALEHIPHLVDDAERDRILRKLPEQVQVLLSFRKSDNSFSDHPGMSSHLSTIKILEILTKIQSYYPVDPDLLQAIKKWIQTRQNQDGSFTPLAADKEVDYYPVDVKKSNGTVQEVDVNEYYYYDKDGNMTQEEIDWERRVEVTAETLVALLEVGVENQIDADVAKKSQNFLEHNLHNLTSPAALAATVLALVLARSPIVPEALVILRNASTTEEGEFGWPAPRKDAADWLLEETSRNIKTTSYEAVTMEQYVAGVRVLLAACARGALAEGEAAARFLYYRASTLQRHPSLAYSATKAAAQYAALAHDRHRALTVSLATAGMELTDTLELRARTPPRPLQLPGLPTKVFVYATGAGCATVQGTITYSTYTPKPENTLLNIQAAIIEEIHPERSSIEDLQGNLPTLIIKTCFKWKGKERSGILRLESSLFSGYELHSVNPVVLDGATFADLHYGSRGESVWFVFANISSTCPVCVTYEVRSKFVITSLRPAFAKIYPSTRPDLAVETFFHARPGSPLLRGITDDDFITWFDKTELASLKTSANIDNICECGRICSRDYEFRKNYDDHSISSTVIVETTNVIETTTLTSTEPSTTEETTTTGSSTSTTEIVTTDESSTIIIERSDDPIIIPTVTYSKKTDTPDVNNNIGPLLPKINGELIVQKLALPKVPKKEEIKKKQLPRRKGTLKATYGDKHEKFFLKLKQIESTVSTTTAYTTTEENKVVFSKGKNITSEIPAPISKKIEYPIYKVILEKTDVKKSLLPVNLVVNETHIKSKMTNNSLVANNIKGNGDNITETKTTTTQIPHTDITTVSAIESILPITFLHSDASLPHTITAITNNNIQSIHYRTKKPKAITQIKKPLIHAVHNATKYNKSEHIDSDIINMTKKKTMIPNKYNAKTLKSINKEIHKIPPTPMSETSKTLSESLKYDIAPENKGGFEILDKNNLWELLKEGSDNDASKTEEKLHIHNRLNMLGQNLSNVDDNRSL